MSIIKNESNIENNTENIKKSKTKSVSECKEGFGKKNIIEGLDNPPSNYKWTWGNIKDTLNDMVPDLENFGINTIYIIIIVFVIWKFGSHVIWFNSIPRELLKVLYPPGYEYVKDVLNENMKKKDCHNIVETGGVRKIKAEYFPDQKALFEERKSCCEGLEQPYKEGETIDIPCWPLSTDSDTVKRLNEEDDNYMAYNNDYTDCVNYVQWKQQQKADAEQARADAMSAETQQVQTKNTMEKAQLDQSGGGKMVQVGGQTPYLLQGVKSLGSGLSRAAGSVGAAFRAGDDKYIGARQLAQGMGQRIGQGAQSLGAAGMELGSRAVNAYNERARAEADAAASARAAAMTDFNDDSTYNNIEAMNKNMIAKLTKSKIPQASQELNINTSAPIGAQPIETTSSESQVMGRGEFEPSGPMAESAPTVAIKAGEEEDEVDAALLNKLQKSKDISPQQMEQILQQQASQNQKRQFLQEKEAARLSQSAMIARAEEAAKKASEDNKLAIKREANENKLVERHQKNQVKLKEQIEMNTKMQNFKLASKLTKLMNQSDIKHKQLLEKIRENNEKREGEIDYKLRAKLDKEQLQNYKQMNEANVKAQIDLDKESQQSTKEKILGYGGILKSILKGLKYFITLIPRFFIAIAKFTIGCSWDQDWQGWVLGPNTANSLWASYTLAVKSSISWAVYNCLNMSSGNIVSAFLICTVLLTIMIGLIQSVWVSPLSTVWTLLDFNWPPPMKWMSFLGLPLLFAINAIMFGLMFLFFAIYYIGGFWISCLFSRKGDKFKSQLRGCTSVQSSLRRLFFLLTIYNAYINLPTQVLIGMIVFFLFIEYKTSK